MCLIYQTKKISKGVKSMKDIFTSIYKNSLWGNSESVSGTGSSIAQTSKIIKQLPILIKEFQIRTILDAPCGDFHWMKKVTSGLELYTGVDIVSELIKENIRKYSSYNRQFLNLDISKEPLPTADLILCRDCLVHLSFNDINSVINNFKNTESKYLLTTTFTNRPWNIDIKTGGWRPLNLEIYPFTLSKPILVINENCTEGNMEYNDKSLALWDLAQLSI